MKPQDCGWMKRHKVKSPAAEPLSQPTGQCQRPRTPCGPSEPACPTGAPPDFCHTVLGPTLGLIRSTCSLMSICCSRDVCKPHAYGFVTLVVHKGPDVCTASPPSAPV